MIRVLMVSIAMMVCGYSDAQEMQFGVKGGLLASSFRNYRANIKYDNDYFLNDYNNGYGDSGIGIYVGGFVDFALNDQFHLQPELLINAVQYNTAISIPVLLKLEFIDKVNVMAGPGLNVSFDSQDGEFSPSFNIGGSYDILNNFFVEARIDVGLSGYLRTNLMAGAGYKFD